ncbi:MAG TPA: EMC3/TMCO1 family protein [Nitrososphaerales archaeon]|nr:EMC3/TMCO1 family protein [Nitrososphaerales archaeon]
MIRTRSRGAGASKTILYIVLIFIALISVYYVVATVFFPPAPPGPAVSLSPATDISGSVITILGKGLDANTTVRATLNGQPLSLGGTCQTSSAGALAGCTFTVPQLASGSYAVSVSDAAKTLRATLTIPQIVPPVSTIIVSLTSIGLAVVTQLVTLRLVDLKAERKMRAEISQFQADLRDAMKKGDKAKEEKLKKKQAAMTQMNAKVSTARLKVTAITFVPFLLLYYVMAYLLGGFSVTVANSPIPIPLLVSAQGTLPLFWWYSISSLTFSPMLTKVFGTST